MKIVRAIAAALLAVFFAVVVSACEHKGPAERAGEKVDNAAQTARDKAEDMGDKAGDKAEDMGDKAEDATDK